MKIASCLLAALSIFAGDPGFANEERVQMRTAWFVEASGLTSDAVETKLGGVIIAQRLLPKGLIETNDPIVDAAGADDFPARTQLIAVLSSKYEIFCEAPLRPKPFSLGGSQICFVDRNGDGTLDQFFKAHAPTPVIFMTNEMLPQTLTDMTPIAYRAVDPKEMKERFVVAIKLNRGWTGLYVAQVFFGRDDKLQQLVSASAAFAPKVFPGEVSLMGANLRILDNKNGVHRVEIIKSMPAQPFNLTTTTTFRTISVR